MYSEANDFLEKVRYLNRLRTALTNLDKNWQLEKCFSALEIGGGGGLFSGLVAGNGPRVICTDLSNHQVKYNGEFACLLQKKFERNGYKLNLDKIEFHAADAQSLIYRDNIFDLVFSLNAFEHIPDPLLAITEVHRVLRKGGYFYASLDPIWTADSGSHFAHYVNEPWLHLLIDDNSFREKMKQGGAPNQQISEYPNSLNRHPAEFYKTVFKLTLDKLFSEVSVKSWSGCISADFKDHPNRFIAASKNGLDPDDLLIRGFEIVAKK